MKHTFKYVIVAAAVALFGLVPTATAASAAPGDSGQRWSGKGAVAHLGTRLPAVAAASGMSTATLRRHFEEDPTLYVDGTDRLLYVEEAAPVTQEAPSGATPFDTTIADTDTFLLHSRPGANRVIYLDFNGQTLSGTAWNSGTGGDCYAEPYDTDNLPNSFSTAEMDVVKSVWKRVSEDYSMFDVDVTTEEPPVAALDRTDSNDQQFGTRALITKSVTPCSNGQTLYQAACGGSCGGVAYVGVYGLSGSSHLYYQPALVFQNGVGGAKNIAEATSHEVGHNIGLSHDGTTTGCGTGGTSACGYYTGQGSWAPIMGVGYYKAIVQWSKGDYANANNKEDDFVVAGNNGLPLRGDDHGNSSATATVLSGTTIGARGVIGTRTDVDAFTVAVGAGPLTLTASPVPTSPNLDVRLELRDSGGALVASADPASGSTSSDAPTGLGATISTTVAGGVYTLLVDGVGSGDPLSTGYSDYASLGNYALTGTVVPSGEQAPTASFTATPTSGIAPLPVTFDGSASVDPEGGALTYAWSFGDGGTATGGPGASHTYTAAGTYTATLTVTDIAGLSASTTRTITVTAPPVRIDISTLTLKTTRNKSNVSGSASATVKNSSGAVVASATVTGQWYLGTKLLSTKSATTATTGIAAISSGTTKASAGQVLKFCVTGLAKTGTTWDATIYAPTTATDCVSWTIV